MSNTRRLLVLMAVAGMLAVSTGTVLAQQADGFTGTAVISSSNATSDTVTWDLKNVDSVGAIYEGWLVSDDGGTRLSTGVMTVAEDGSVNHLFVSSDGENLLEGYNKAIITVDGVVAYSAVVESAAIGNIRSALAGGGSIEDLTSELQAAVASANAARAEFSASDLTATKSNVQSALSRIGGILTAINAVISEAEQGFGAISSDADNADVMSTHLDGIRSQAEGIRTRVLRAQDLGNQIDASDNATLIDLVWLGPGADTLVTNLDVSLNGSAVTGATFLGKSGVSSEMLGMATYVLVPGVLIDESEGGGGPGVGDGMVPFMAQMAVIASVILLLGGGLLTMRGRARVRA